jgi:hypothetical protein
MWPTNPTVVAAKMRYQNRWLIYMLTGWNMAAPVISIPIPIIPAIPDMSMLSNYCVGVVRDFASKKQRITRWETIRSGATATWKSESGVRESDVGVGEWRENERTKSRRQETRVRVSGGRKEAEEVTRGRE